MSAEILHIRERIPNNGWSVEDALETALAYVRNGDVAAKKVLIVLLDDDGHQYNRYQIQAGMNRMEIVAVSEATKFAALKDE